MRWTPALTKYISTNKFAALKIYAHDLVSKDEIENESAIYKHISTAGNQDHPGKMFVRTIQDSFFVKSRAGHSHHCLVHEVLSNDILSLRYALPDRKMPEAMLKQTLIHLLLALDFLHDECHIIHTGESIVVRFAATVNPCLRYKRREYFAGSARSFYLGTTRCKGYCGIKPLQAYKRLQPVQKRKLWYSKKIWPSDFV
jgi:hypothetical protein